ncbi:MAG: hypothetical protein OSA51_06130 [Octadecabacter sp.]|nr:hypothetical protein [Octadecabacter sp.]
MFRVAVIFLVLTACTPMLVSPENVEEFCEEKARSARSPTGQASVGTNSRTGGFSRVEIGVSSDFIAGHDPVEVYEQCFFDLTGAFPTLPPVLR